MAKLIATGPFDGRLPLEGRGVVVEAADFEPMTLVIAARGTAPKVSGLTFPEPGEVRSSGTKRLIWMGPGQALLCGAEAPKAEPLVTMDHSDAWAVARVSGDAGPDVLSRLVPLDLRVTVFPVGSTARTLIGHMTGSVIRIDEITLDLIVMRSMAGTLVHDLERALRTSER